MALFESGVVDNLEASLGFLLVRLLLYGAVPLEIRIRAFRTPIESADVQFSYVTVHLMDIAYVIERVLDTVHLNPTRIVAEERYDTTPYDIISTADQQHIADGD